MNELTLKKEEIVKLMSKNNLKEIFKPFQKNILLKEVFVDLDDKGEMLVNKDLKDGKTLVLIRNPKLYNQFNIDVCVDKNTKLGSISCMDDEILARLMDAGKEIVAIIRHISISFEKSSLLASIYLIDY